MLFNYSIAKGGLYTYIFSSVYKYWVSFGIWLLLSFGSFEVVYSWKNVWCFL